MLLSTAPFSLRSMRLGLFGIIGVAAVVLLGAQPASAQYRARLSRGLESRLADGGGNVTVTLASAVAVSVSAQTDMVFVGP